MPVSVRLAVRADFSDILRLQSQNFIDNLSPDERADGFISTPFSLELMNELEAPNRFLVARDDGTNALAGYVFAGSWEFCSLWPAFQVAIARFPLRWKGDPLDVDSTFQYGPVCIAREFRGQGVLPLLLAEVKSQMREEFAVGTTWINRANGRSMNAHVEKQDFVVLDEWQWDGKEFVTLGFPTHDSPALDENGAVVCVDTVN